MAEWRARSSVASMEHNWAGWMACWLVDYWGTLKVLMRAAPMGWKMAGYWDKCLVGSKDWHLVEHWGDRWAGTKAYQRAEYSEMILAALTGNLKAAQMA